MPKQRKQSTARKLSTSKKQSTAKLSTPTIKETSNDICGFWNLHTQSKNIISNHFKGNDINFDWLQDVFQEAQDRVENVQKDSASDISQSDGMGDANKKDNEQTVLSSQENGGMKRRKKNVEKDSGLDNSQLDEVDDTSKKDSDQPVSSCQEEDGTKRRRRKKRSSKLRKSSSASRKVTVAKSSLKNSDSVHFDEDKENINVNNSSKNESDTSQDIIDRSPLCKAGNDKQLNDGTPVGVKANYPIVVLGPLVRSGESSEPMVTQNGHSSHTPVAQLTKEVQETVGTVSNNEMRNPVVVLERLTDGKPTESNQYAVSPSDRDRKSLKKLSLENETKTLRASGTVKCKDSIVVLEPLVIAKCKDSVVVLEPSAKCKDSIVVLEPLVNTQCTELGEPAVRTSKRISGKRKLTEVCDSSHSPSEPASSAGETRRRSSRISVGDRRSIENLEPVSKMPKLSLAEKYVSSEGSEDNNKNKMSKTHGVDSDSADSGTYCVGSSGGSGSESKRSYTSISGSSTQESLAAVKNWQLQSVKKNGQLNRQRSQESLGYKTPENYTLKKDFSNSTLRLQSYRPMLSQSRTTPKTTFVFSSSKTANQLSRSKLLSGSYSTKPCTPLHSMNTSILKSQATAHEAEKEKYKQEEARRQQEKEQALLKKQQLLQMRVEEQKRKREARMQKNLEARQQLDREKAERQKVIEQKETKISNIAKEKAKEVKKSRLKTDFSDDCGSTKKLCGAKPADKVLHTPMDAAKMHREALSAKPVVSVVKHAPSEAAKSSENKSVKASEPQAAVLNSTFVKSDEAPCESYEMTPARPRSTYCNYDISELRSDDDSEDECAPMKPIPSWAVGMRFKQALISQHHNPPDVEQLFGATVVPDLSEMFETRKPRYHKRTSSAIWNTPDKIVFAVKSYS